MSLLMQALKKAERAKQNSGQDSELDKPSEAFDEILSLSPQEPPAAPVPAPAPAAPSFSLDSLSLAPIDDTPGVPTPAPAPAAASLPPVPAASVASEASHDPVPPQARHAGNAADAPAPPSASARVKAELKADLQAAEAAAKAKTEAGADKGAPRAAAARARAAASAPAAERAAIDPAKLRIAILGGIVLVIVLGYGYYFWQATNGPGSGGRLPMVPMPPPNATGATSALVVVPGAPAPRNDAAPADAALEPPPLTPQERQRRERQQERDQLYAQLMSQIQSQLQQQQQPAPPETLPAVAAPEATDIKVARSTVPAQVPPALSSAYSALGRGDLAGAQQQYDTMLRQDPNNRDALLGEATVAQRAHQDERAAAAYSRLLELDPADGDALAGLAGLRQGDPTQSELRLKSALKRNPDSGPVLFALGNLYARQGRWPEAQQTYFRAYSAVPSNADYAFNLAVGLDRLNQPRLALTYYQRALALAQDQQAGFDRAALRKRLQELGAPAQP